MTVLNERPDFVVVLRRNYEDRYLTIGDLEIWHKDAVIWRCATLEPPWMGNCPFLSRIPEGWYKMFRSRYEKGDYDTWELADVPGRAEVKPHIGNYWTDTDGCQLLGREAKMGRPTFEITNSKETHAEFMAQMAPAENPVLVVLDETRAPLGG